MNYTYIIRKHYYAQSSHAEMVLVLGLCSKVCLLCVLTFPKFLAYHACFIMPIILRKTDKDK